MKKLSSKKIYAGLLAFGLAGLLAMPLLANAQITDPAAEEYGLKTGGDFEGAVKLGKRDVKATIGDVINVVLGILGIIAVVIIVAGGFTWMTAAGNEDKVGTAKKMITQGVIGLVIVFAAWGIASFVINQLSSAAKVS